MYGIFARIWLILMANNWYIYIPVPWILWGEKIIIPKTSHLNITSHKLFWAASYWGTSCFHQKWTTARSAKWMKTPTSMCQGDTWGGQNGLIGRTSMRSQHIDNIEYPPGNNHISRLWKRKILFPATFQGDVLLPWKLTIYSVRLVIKPDNWFFNTV